MKTRIITAVILIPLLVLILLADSPVITAAVIVISAMGSYEFYKATGLWNKKCLCAAGLLAAVLVPLMGYIPQNFYMLILYVYMLIFFVLSLAQHRSVSVGDVSLVIFSVIYIPYFLTNLLYVRLLDHGEFYLWLPFVGAFLTDTGAYFSGVFLGRHKLCPEISPKKTVEGSVGGIIVCMGACMLFGLLVEKLWLLDVNYIHLAVLGVIMSTVSQLGDLSASIIKRKYGIKDYGSIFPGHGGILDRLDSVIMIAPAVYLFVVNFAIFK